MAQKSGYREAYERRHGIPEQNLCSQYTCPCRSISVPQVHYITWGDACTYAHRRTFYTPRFRPVSNPRPFQAQCIPSNHSIHKSTQTTPKQPIPIYGSTFWVSINLTNSVPSFGTDQTAVQGLILTETSKNI